MTPPTGQVSTTDVKQMEGDFHKATESVRTALHSVNSKFGEFETSTAGIRIALQIAQPAIGQWVNDNIETARKRIDEIAGKANYVLDHCTPVLSLMTTSFHWLDQVQSPLSDLAFTAGNPADANLAYWQGGAATAYGTKQGQQQAALQDVKDKAAFISGWLMGIARSNVDYMTTMSQILTKIVGKIVQAIADAAGVVTIVLAATALSDSVGDLVTDGLNLLVDEINRFVAMADDIRQVREQTGDHSNLPGGRWPEAVYG
ncbi:hypothetical protein ACFFWC_26220 [Plantactinospora siamensis]|uniref:WXG100 family type VII secretion target n=1 Tax=Plantactinospora siamensis TaxID=555372 RepID=A0ABV6P5Z9_9ACTN